MKQYFKGWGFNLQGELRKKRKVIQAELTQLEECEEKMNLNSHQLSRKVELLTENLYLLLQEESYWYNRSHETWLHKGDNNTSFFHKCANGRKRKTTILSLEKDGELIEGDENFLKHATDTIRAFLDLSLDLILKLTLLPGRNVRN